ncbi:MAG: PD-(D/E)XK nuclease domain-containing protein [Prevotella sp.]|nr:PD-(D/E)XK nuclease domain-containing protein [Prevotella sp.]
MCGKNAIPRVGGRHQAGHYTATKVAYLHGLYPLRLYVRTQVKVAGGRIDMVIFMPDAIYVMELKVSDTAHHALEQINDRGYAKPFLSDGRRVVKVGVSFDADKFTVGEWEVEED